MSIKNPDYKALAISSLCTALLQDIDADTRLIAAESLGKLQSEYAIPALTQAMLNDSNKNVRQKAAEALGKIGEQSKMTGDSRVINATNYYENISTGGGDYIQGDYINMSQDLSQAASQIQSLLEKLQQQGITVDVAQEQVAQDIANQAKNSPKMRDKLVNWGQSVGNATITDVVKGAVMLAIRSAGIPLP